MFLWAIFIGLIIGAVARLLMPGRDPGGFIVTILIGITGAILAKIIGEAIGWYGPYEPVGFIASVLGAMILLLIFRIISGRKV